ncbi:hypothetical protein EJ03DRAFT_101795 [Teratosphaeria nubilosa]|uniref:Uncharacterized protein n=1 Tax=Teratosphaeria nubilosa TaxID=161662 RepID=A0A6G1LKU7_9PEZI|nr:hypothetical protein EJ03DRAFT_101795 [Teratosphaeria nubilosa]
MRPDLSWTAREPFTGTICLVLPVSAALYEQRAMAHHVLCATGNDGFVLSRTQCCGILPTTNLYVINSSGVRVKEPDFCNVHLVYVVHRQVKWSTKVPSTKSTSDESSINFFMGLINGLRAVR